jgi:hypothetical protein
MMKMLEDFTDEECKEADAEQKKVTEEIAKVLGRLLERVPQERAHIAFYAVSKAIIGLEYAHLEVSPPALRIEYVELKKDTLLLRALKEMVGEDNCGSQTVQ